MLREPQHERKMVNVINVISVRPELSRRASHFFHTLSVDFLHVVFGLHKELGIEIPDAEVAKFTTWNCGVRYLLSKAGKT